MEMSDKNMENGLYPIVPACRKNCRDKKVIQGRAVDHCSLGVLVVRIRVMVMCGHVNRRFSWVVAKRDLLAVCPRRGNAGEKHEQTTNGCGQAFHCWMLKLCLVDNAFSRVCIQTDVALIACALWFTP
jgi:hypothetical protein